MQLLYSVTIHMTVKQNLTLVPDFFNAGPSTTINSGAGTSTAGSSERTEDAFHQPANTHATNNVESVSEMAIVPAIPTSTHVHTRQTTHKQEKHPPILK